MSYTKIDSVFYELKRILPGFTELYWVLLSCHEFYQI